MEDSIIIQGHDVGVQFTRQSGEGVSLRQTLRALAGRRDDRSFWAVRHASFAVRRGECLGIVGRNGSGKTTLLKTISGVIQPDEGRVDIAGRATALHPGAGFRPDLSGVDNIYLNGSVLGLTKGEIDAARDEILEFAELGDFINMPIKFYSTGMRARLAFAIATSLKPEVLLIDESLSSGDEAFRKKAEGRMHRLLGESKCLVVVSHATSFILEHCTRVIWMRQGRIVDDGDTGTIVKRYLEYSKLAVPLSVERAARETELAAAGER